MDTPAALRPLAEADGEIRRLDEYRTTAELASAIEVVAGAVERSLRIFLRGDRTAPDDDRLSALSGESFPFDAVLQSLRARDRVSLELAGTVHELQAVADRARRAETRPADADVAQRAVSLVRAELDVGAQPGEAPGADGTPAASAGSADAAASSPLTRHAEPPEHAAAGHRWMAWAGAALAALILLGLAWVLVRGGNSDYEDGVAAFRAGRYDSAAVAFQRVLEDRPEDVATMLYLGRIHRRQARFDAAAEVLRSAAAVAPEDGDVRRELGHLFMDLGQPEAAARQYERAIEQEPEEILSWAGLIRALRASGDPRAERLLQDAPAGVQAALGRSGAGGGGAGGGAADTAPAGGAGLDGAGD